MRARAPSCIAAKSDDVTGPYLLILVNELLRQVAVDGLQSVGVSDDDILAIASSLVSYDAYFS